MKTLLLDFGCILAGLSKELCISALNQVGCGRIAYYVDECKQEDLFHDLEVGGSIENFCEEARKRSSYTDEMGVFRRCEASDEEVCWAWNELLREIPIKKLRFIKHLKDNLGYRIAILSNTNEIHWEKARKLYFTADGLQMEDYIDDIFLSCRLGMVKPEMRLFEEVKRQLGNDIFFIDDSAKNCNAAVAAGIPSLHDATGEKWMQQIGDKAAVIGNFDGVHLGHRFIIDNLKREAEKRGLSTTAITFDRHPRTLFDTNLVGTYLCSVEEKAQLLRASGIDEVSVIPFTKEFASIPAKTFMKEVLHDEMGVKLLLLGYDNRFGKRNEGEGFKQYREYGREIGIEVLRAEPMETPDGAEFPDEMGKNCRISSSLVRRFLKEGRMEEVAFCLKRPYSLRGKVVEGHREGRKIGYPTANISVAKDKLLPANGVYSTRVEIDGKAYKAITNIGMRPTYDGMGLTIETYIIGFEGDLYGKTLCVEVLRRLREERRFTSPQDLKEQISHDIRMMEAE